MVRALHKLSDAAAKSDRSEAGSAFRRRRPLSQRLQVLGPSRGFSSGSKDQRKREMGLGAFPSVSLASARDRAARCRTGGRRSRPIARSASAVPEDLRGCRRRLLAMRGNWRNRKTHDRMGHRALVHGHCAAIRVKRCVDPDGGCPAGAEAALGDQGGNGEQASGYDRTRPRFCPGQRVEARREPSRWRGHLQNALPKPRALTRGHLPAMDYHEVPAFIERLNQSLRRLRRVPSSSLSSPPRGLARCSVRYGQRSILKVAIGRCQRRG